MLMMMFVATMPAKYPKKTEDRTQLVRWAKNCVIKPRTPTVARTASAPKRTPSKSSCGSEKCWRPITKADAIAIRMHKTKARWLAIVVFISHLEQDGSAEDARAPWVINHEQPPPIGLL